MAVLFLVACASEDSSYWDQQDALRREANEDLVPCDSTYWAATTCAHVCAAPIAPSSEPAETLECAKAAEGYFFANYSNHLGTCDRSDDGMILWDPCWDPNEPRE